MVEHEENMNIIKRIYKNEIVQSVFVAGVVSFFIINFIMQAFYIPSGSMEPTLKPGDRIFVNKVIYKLREVKRGEIIVFKVPINANNEQMVNQDTNFIKRLIALPGDKVMIEEGRVYINGELLDEPYIKNRSYDDRDEIIIPEGYYYFLGDNRNNSYDSRFWGLVPKKNIVGKSFLIFWPLNRIRIIKE